MTIAVIIPCLNEEQYIGKLLEDLTKQDAKPNEVFVVDCHSKDRTVKVAKKFMGRLPLCILQSTYRSAAAARNTGADAAKAEFLLFLDADMRIEPDFIEQLALRASTKRVDFVSPRLKTESHHPVDHLIVWGLNFWNYFYHMLLRRRVGLVGGAMLIKKSIHEAIGGYNPKLREFDDVDYMMKMWRHKVSFAFCWKVAANHSNRRLVEQGRFTSIIQGLSEHHFLVRHVVRPIMKRAGIKPQWHNLD